MDANEIRLIIATLEPETFKYQSITVSPTLTSAEIIQQKLGLIPEIRERLPLNSLRDPEPKYAGKMYTRKTAYYLSCHQFDVTDKDYNWSLFNQYMYESVQDTARLDVPAEQRDYPEGLPLVLDHNMPIGHYALTNDTVLNLDKIELEEFDSREDDPAQNRELLGIFDSAYLFNKALLYDVSGVEDRSDPTFALAPLVSILLYTDEDVELAKYIRDHFEELFQLTWQKFAVFVLERPPRLSIAEIIAYWKKLLEFETYVIWGSIGVMRTKPYDKSAAYDIARRLGIPAYQLPCIAFINRDAIESGNSIVVPIHGDLTHFFRTLFGSIEEALPKLESNYVSKAEGWKALKSVIQSIGTMQDNNSPKEAKYEFYGQTVFINQPSGSVHLDNFQNSNQPSTDSSK